MDNTLSGPVDVLAVNQVVRLERDGSRIVACYADGARVSWGSCTTERGAKGRLSHHAKRLGFIVRGDVALAPIGSAEALNLVGALRKAEAALSDIGDADREPGDDLAWCEARASQDLPTIRAALANVGGAK